MGSRRDLILGAAAATVALACKPSRPPNEEPAPSVSHDSHDNSEALAPTEGLMREHAILERVLIVYDECARRLESNADPGAGVLSATARLVRAFVHDYHEAMEEDALFPRCEKSLVHVALVRTLREQHAVGRKLTEYVAQASPSKDKKKLAGALRSFSRMYRAHSAREDSVLFPAFHDLVRGAERDELSAQFIARGRALFGDDAYARKVAEVAELEAALDLADLGRATASDLK
jgi:hemerythrin-like domain-containing protein